MKIIYTKHAEKKIIDLLQLGVSITKRKILAVLRHPLHVDKETDYPAIIASGTFDERHVLRVVYRQEGDIIIVITCYPAKKGRYFS